MYVTLCLFPYNQVSACNGLSSFCALTWRCPEWVLLHSAALICATRFSCIRDDLTLSSFCSLICSTLTLPGQADEYHSGCSAWAFRFLLCNNKDALDSGQCSIWCGWSYHIFSVSTRGLPFSTDRQLVVATCKDASQCANKGSAETNKCEFTQCRILNIFKIGLANELWGRKCFQPLLELKDKYYTFCWENLNVKIRFLCWQENFNHPFISNKATHFHVSFSHVPVSGPLCSLLLSSPLHHARCCWPL